MTSRRRSWARAAGAAAALPCQRVACSVYPAADGAEDCRCRASRRASGPRRRRCRPGDNICRAREHHRKDYRVQASGMHSTRLTAWAVLLVWAGLPSYFRLKKIIGRSSFFFYTCHIGLNWGTEKLSNPYRQIVLGK